MSQKMQLQIGMKQQLRMTQQLQQAIRLLQLSRQELVASIQEEMTENPALEELPELCYFVRESPRELMVSKRGETGYHPCGYNTPDM